MLTKNQLSIIAEADSGELSSGDDETARQLGKVQKEAAPVTSVVGGVFDLVGNNGPDIYNNESEESDSESCSSNDDVKLR